jgi:hypothetical protein
MMLTATVEGCQNNCAEYSHAALSCCPKRKRRCHTRSSNGKQSDGKQGEGAFSAARLQAVLEGAYEYELELASDLAVGVINDFQTMSIRQSLLLGTTG